MSYTLKYTLIDNDAHYKVSGYTGEPIDVIIPSEHEDKPVTSIGDSAFYNCSSLESIVVPEGVTSIGTYAFSSCTNLNNISLPDTLTSIGMQAFRWCYALKSIKIPDSVTEVGDLLFNNIKNLEKVTTPAFIIPKFGYTGVKEIIITSGDNVPAKACSGFAELKNITIPDTVKSIGEGAFASCKSLTSIEIPNSVTSIGQHAFQSCNKLTNVTLPKKITAINAYVFRYCSSLTSIEIPESVTSIGDYAFGDCSSLTKVNYLGSIEQWMKIEFGYYQGQPLSYGADLYIKNTLVQNIIISEETKIPDRVFQGCTSLKNITILDNVTSIGNSAFQNCINLMAVNLLPKTILDTGSNMFTNATEVKFYCYSSSLENYKGATDWEAYADKFVADDMRLTFIVSANAQNQYFASKEWVVAQIAALKAELQK